MVLYIRYVFGAAIIVSFASAAFGIHCYKCNNFPNNLTDHEQSACDDPFQENKLNKRTNCHLLTAPQNVQRLRPDKHIEAVGCIKKVFQQGDKTLIQRSCYWGNLADTKMVCNDNPVLPNLEQLSCDVCDSEMCNSSTTIGLVPSILSICYILARMMS